MVAEALMARKLLAAVVLGSCLLPAAVRAHHSGSEYSRNVVEIEGTLLAVSWRNPHVHFTVRAPDPSGKVLTWDIEANSLSILRRTDATPENLKVGDKIKVAGTPSDRAPNRMWAMHILTAGGREIVLGPGVPPRWGTTALGSKSTWFEGGTDADKTAGIFRVWSTQFGAGGGLWRRDYPLTDTASKARAGFNRLTDSVAPGCRPKGMPTIMEQPYPLEFVRKGENILLRLEEYDTVRTIVMSPTANLDAQPKTLLGRSKGRWDGGTLVVTTSRIDWRYFDPSGIPLGPAATIVERFTPSSDGTRLNYTMTVTDPATFTQPVELSRSWVWRRGETVKPYDCVEAGRSQR
jgi:hypothetical protein